MKNKRKLYEQAARSALPGNDKSAPNRITEEQNEFADSANGSGGGGFGISNGSGAPGVSGSHVRSGYIRAAGNSGAGSSGGRSNGSGGSGGNSGPSGPGGPGGPGGYVPGGPGSPGNPNTPRGSDPRKRRSRNRLRTVLIIVLILVVGLFGSAYLFWNSLMNRINLVNPSDATLPSEFDEPTDSLVNPVPTERGIINILLLGSDARDENTSEVNTNTDSMMILTLDQNNKKIKLTSLQRDMLVWMPGRSQPAKLNAANSFGGPALAMRVVNDTFRLDIKNYVVVNMRGMEALIEVAGGVEINVEKDEVEPINQMIGYQNSIYPDTPKSELLKKAGLQKLDGRQAVAYGRIRKLDSDYARMGRQRVVIQALLKSFMNASLGTKANMIAQGLSYATTNFSKTELTTFGLSSLSLMNGEMEELQIPIKGYFVEDPEPVWVNRCDFNGMIPLLQEFIFGRTYPFDPVKVIPGAPNSGQKTPTTGSTTKKTTKATTKATPKATSEATTSATTKPSEPSTTISTTTQVSSTTEATTASETMKSTRATSSQTSNTTTSANEPSATKN